MSVRKEASLILSPTLAGVLGRNHGLHVGHSPLPEGLSSDVTSAGTHIGEHLASCACASIRRSQTKVTRDSGGTSQKLVELVLSDATRAGLICLNEAIQDEVVE